MKVSLRGSTHPIICNDSLWCQMFAYVKQSYYQESIQAIVRWQALSASLVSGKVTTLLYNGRSVCCDTILSSIEKYLFRRVRSEDAFISRDETRGSTSLSIAFVLAPSCSLW